MMTSSNGNIFRVTGPLCVEFTGHTCEFPSQRPVTRSFDGFFDLHLNKRLRKPLWGWLFETSSLSLWRHRNDHSMALLFWRHHTISWRGIHNAVECRYIAVQFITILHTALRWQQQNINQTSNSQQTPHTSPSRAIGCQLGKFWRKLTAF